MNIIQTFKYYIMCLFYYIMCLLLGIILNIWELLRLFNAGTGGGTGAAIDFYHGGPNKNARIRSYATGANEGDLYFEPANGTGE